MRRMHYVPKECVESDHKARRVAKAQVIVVFVRASERAGVNAGDQTQNREVREHAHQQLIDLLRKVRHGENASR
jgi:hypothetical protein